MGQLGVQLAEQCVGQPAQDCFTPVPGGASMLVVGLGSGRALGCLEGPPAEGLGQSPVARAAQQDDS